MISIKNVVAVPNDSGGCAGCVYEGQVCKDRVAEAEADNSGLSPCYDGFIYVVKPSTAHVQISFEPDGESFRLNVCGKQSKVFDVYDLCPEGVEAVEDAVQFICEELGIEVTENGRLVL